VPFDDASLPNVIADVGATLRQLLQEQIADLNPERSEGRVVFASPAEIEATTAPRLGVFLYQVLEAPQMRNYPPEAISLAEVRRYQTVELSYLLTPYTKEIEDSHLLLGRVMRVFFEHSSLQGSILHRALADIGQELRILLQPLSVEELNRLWGLFPNKPYRLSVAYQVTPVKVFAGPTGLAGRVLTTELTYAQLTETR
jgi:hypothetical protein